MRVLITNDDGIGSAGLHALAGVAVEAGLDVVVAAPSREFSGASAALTAVEAGGRIVIEPKELPGLPGVEAYAVAASPAFVVLLAARGTFGPAFDVVLSGINLGVNVGRAVLHSGTVGAALTAADEDRRALAISVDSGWGPDRQDPPRWDTAAAVAADLLPVVKDLPPGVALNVNVPNVGYADLRGTRRAGLARFGRVSMAIAERGDDFVRMGLHVSDDPLEPGTDEALVAGGYVAVTPLRPVREATDVAVSLPLNPT